MHIVLQQYIDDLSESYELTGIPASKLFELFCNYCVVSKHYLSRFNPKSVTADENDASLDGIAFIIDGDLVLTEDDAKEAFETHKTSLSVEIVFNQVKCTESFKKDEIANYKLGIEDFLSLNPQLPNGDFNKEALRIFKSILSNLKKVKNRRPNISVYYCTSGVYRAEDEIQASFNIIERSIGESDFFHYVKVKPVGRSELLKIWSDITDKNEAKLKLIEYMGINSMPKIPQSYVGIVRAKDFVCQILCDEEGNIRNEIFDENIRAFLGEENDVNKDIRATLLDPDKKKRFSVLNNGVTIIAPELSVTPNTKEIDLTNYQIINGCQTSNTLYHNKDLLDDDVMLVVKFIESPDSSVATDIISATNSQTEIGKESFQSLKDKAKLVQKYFDAKLSESSPENRIYFERREKEFHGKGYNATRIFGIKELSRAFTSMFLGEPHTAARYVAKIFSANGEKLFKDEHHESAYFCSALAIYKYSTLINGRKISANEYNKLRWHIMLLFPWTVHGKVENIDPASHKVNKHCEKIIDVLQDVNKSYIDYFKKCQDIIDILEKPTDDSIKRGKYTSDLISQAKKYLAD
jgi:hypothetical protein